ncbi:MAG: hypothetical protein M3R21_00690 [Candidatus Dormibacteraeota bacterium]|nr:hypothetical protein [Candidatus Dormibacteraeota bacterium]
MFVHQGGVETLDEFAFDQDLAVRGVADHVLEDVAGEDDRLRAVVVGFVPTAEWPDAAAVQVFGQGAKAKAAGCVELKDLFDHRSGFGVLNNAAVDTDVALRDGA